MASTDQLRSAGPIWPAAALPSGLRRAQIPVCPLCGSIETERAFKDNGCVLRVCNVCELFFTDPYPSGLRQHLRVASGDHSAITILDCERRYQGERLYYDRHFPLIAEECERAASLLDVGCGTGNLLQRFADRPELRRLGIELNPEAAWFARGVAGCEIIEVPFEQFRGGEKFDVITMINVLSHIPSFDGMFRSIRSALAPGGKVVLRTSEMCGSVSRWNQLHWGIPDDLHFLGIRTLDYLCAKYGFAVARHIRTPYEQELFRPSRWRQMGRSRLLNVAKRAGANLPGILAGLRGAYSATLGGRLFVSFVVLTPLAWNEHGD